MSARTLMVQGTASSAGKSLLVTALCRIFRQRGLRVAPFKSQNMALNSFVTPDGGEIGRAQAVQAEACGIPPSVDMNPILLKPEGNSRSQIVVRGKVVGSMSARDYQSEKPRLRELVAECIQRLRETNDIVVIEGAGSPAEINLKENEIVNMFVARTADAPVLLVGDIDRGGVFAALVGTMELLEPAERCRVAAFIINKFRGDRALLEPGLDFLTKRTGVPVLGVIPHIPQLRIADEDSASLEARMRSAPAQSRQIDIAAIRLPWISNYDDFDPLAHESGVAVRFVDRASGVGQTDLLIVPGSKSTVADLVWLQERGFVSIIHERHDAGKPVLGVCGGCQMLGQSIQDPQHVESGSASVQALGLLPIATTFQRTKLTAQIEARSTGSTFLNSFQPAMIRGYEIHCGMIEHLGKTDAPFEIIRRNGVNVSARDGSVSANGSVVGTMIHGVFENTAVRQALLGRLRQARNLPAAESSIPSHEEEYDRLAAAVRDNIDMGQLLRIAKLS
jgi:adenosylcobyric acid synthase